MTARKILSDPDLVDVDFPFAETDPDRLARAKLSIETRHRKVHLMPFLHPRHAVNFGHVRVANVFQIKTLPWFRDGMFKATLVAMPGYSLKFNGRCDFFCPEATIIIDNDRYHVLARRRAWLMDVGPRADEMARYVNALESGETRDFVTWREATYCPFWEFEAFVDQFGDVDEDPIDPRFEGVNGQETKPSSNDAGNSEGMAI